MKAPSPITAEQVRLLNEFLAAPARPEGTMRYCELAGFLFAIGSSPELIKPSEWLPLIFNDAEAGYGDMSEANRVLEAIMALYNQINGGIYERQPALPPGCEIREQPLANLEPTAPLSQWARGFAAGHDYLEELWEAYTPNEFDEELGGCMMVLSFFASRDMAETYRKEFKLKQNTPEQAAAAMIGLLPDAMQGYAALGRTIYEALLREEAKPREPARSAKVGRNTPCPCGSGKKYKHCCGRGGTLH